MSTDKVKIRYGIENVHIAKMTNHESLTYDTPKPWKGAVSLITKVNNVSENTYADNDVWLSYSDTPDKAGELVVKSVTDEVLEYIYGNAEDKNKLDIEFAKPITDTFALLGEYITDQGRRRFAYYNVSFSKFDEELKTKDKNVPDAEVTVPIVIGPMKFEGFDEPVFKATTKAGTEAAVYNNWFTAVKKPEKKDKA